MLAIRLEADLGVRTSGDENSWRSCFGVLCTRDINDRRLAYCKLVFTQLEWQGEIAGNIWQESLSSHLASDYGPSKLRRSERTAETISTA
jgi:hypothetical protein